MNCSAREAFAAVARSIAITALLSACGGPGTPSRERPATPIPTRDAHLAEVLLRELYQPGTTGYRIAIEPPTPGEYSPFPLARRVELLRQLRRASGDVLFDFRVDIAQYPVEYARSSVTRHGLFLINSGRIVYQTAPHEAAIWLQIGLLSMQLLRRVEDGTAMTYIHYSRYGPGEDQWGGFSVKRGEKVFRFEPNPGPLID